MNKEKLKNRLLDVGGVLIIILLGFPAVTVLCAAFLRALKCWMGFFGQE